jgi:hypothetical protein
MPSIFILVETPPERLQVEFEKAVWVKMRRFALPLMRFSFQTISSTLRFAHSLPPLRTTGTDILAQITVLNSMNDLPEFGRNKRRMKFAPNLKCGKAATSGPGAIDDDHIFPWNHS